MSRKRSGSYLRWPGKIKGCLAIVAVLVWPLCAGAAEEIRYQQLLSFRSGTNDASRPMAPLIEASDGALYGTTASNKLGAVFKLNKDGTGFAVIHYFGSVAHDGVKPWHAGLMEASEGMLYGTTVFGGTNGKGTTFKLNKDGSGYAVLHSFTGGNDGAEPSAEMIEGTDGTLYGTAYTGGPAGYYGTAFAMAKNGGNFRVLHAFGPGTSSDGTQPSASLLEAKDGVLYGTTLTGGGEAVGSAFKINKDGSGYTKLHTFTDFAINPFAQLTEGSDGALYGTAFGSSGGVFKLNKDGTNYRLLLGLSGGEPFSKLIKGRDGTFYGTTFDGVFGSGGSVFRIKEDGSGFQVVHSFISTGNQARNPGAGLILGKDGAFYGTTYAGGDFNGGTVFRLLVNRVPVAQCTNLMVSAGTNCAADVSVDNGSFDPDGDPTTLHQTPPGPYPLGTNLVTLTVTDSNGASNVCTASVVVLDTTPPTISCSSNIMVEFASDQGAGVTYSVAAADYCDLNPIITSAPASGSTFPIGVTAVHSTAMDASSNSSTCSFTVTVLGARGVKSNVLAELIALRTAIGCGRDNHVDENVCGKLDYAIRHLETCLHSELWIDETHIQRSSGKEVFQEEAHAIDKLCQLLASKKTDLPDSLLQDWINRLTRADRLLASVALQEAFAAGGSGRKLNQVQSFLQSGDAESAGGKCGSGIEDYRNAWKFAARPQITPPAQLAGRRVRLEILSAPGDEVTIQASSNLIEWVTIGSGIADAEGTITFEDADSAGYAVRYYRSFSN